MRRSAVSEDPKVIAEAAVLAVLVIVVVGTGLYRLIALLIG